MNNDVNYHKCGQYLPIIVIIWTINKLRFLQTMILFSLMVKETTSLNSFPPHYTLISFALWVGIPTEKHN